MRFTAVVALVFAGAATAGPAVRTAEQRQTLIDLAHALGEAHALHRVCAGEGDATWRGRMERLLEVEAPADAFKARLTDSFNAGFTAKEAQVKDCKTAADREAVVAKRGAELARKLAGPVP